MQHANIYKNCNRGGWKCDICVCIDKLRIYVQHFRIDIETDTLYGYIDNEIVIFGNIANADVEIHHTC